MKPEKQYPSPPFTAGKVREIVASEWESDLPDTILGILRPLEGKQFTKRTLEKLPGGSERWRFRLEYGTAHITERCYDRTGGNEGISILLAHHEKGVIISCAEILRLNPCYYSAKDERNGKRLIAKNDAKLCDDMAKALNNCLMARETLAKCEKRLAELCEWGSGDAGPFESDRFTWRKLSGEVSK